MKKLILGVLMVSITMAGQVFAGGFSQSCKDLSLDHSTLQAKCLQAKQAQYGSTTKIDLDNYIGNTGGTLVWNGKNFDKHCESKKIESAGYGRTLLKASCKNAAGVYVNAEINLDERISNIDSHLKYDN